MIVGELSLRGGLERRSRFVDQDKRTSNGDGTEGALELHAEAWSLEGHGPFILHLQDLRSFTSTPFPHCIDSSGFSLFKHGPLKLFMELQDARTHRWDDLTKTYPTNPRFEVEILRPVSIACKGDRMDTLTHVILGTPPQKIVPSFIRPS
jgi:hypothetical protein